ncbi:tRNA (N6-isopentenyl adenosine(37)-C2)-methylthiotransferase MiaB [Patescibacteria group bacterium]|nr:tRNA (N6-isopentenyl adenosine(37)-C2)-methylthiotransferase MiaB [Patescibacteria group bacterium]
MKKYFVMAFGCQMNKSDSERVAAVLEKIGYKPAKNEKQADLVVLVACSVRQAAVDRLYGRARELSKIKKINPDFKTILTGCVLPQDKKKLIGKFDLVLDLKQLVDLEKFKNYCQSWQEHYFKIEPRYSTKFSVFVPIMTGCNNFCSYCAVPYVRGREVSRDVADILAEAKNLSEKGCLEITLLGQNVNAYRPADLKNFSKKNPYKHPFAALLWEVNKINGVERMHFTAPHPRDMTDDVIDALTLPKVVNYLHLPLQAGDDKVLKRMNRSYTAADYLKLVAKINKKNPGIALGTDIIVGFPGETKRAFQNTVELYKKAEFDIAYLAIYSPREGTAAAKFRDDVPRHEKKRRRDVLQNLMEKIVLEKNQKYVGKVVSVLVDDYKKGKCVGNSREMKRVRFPGKKNMIGKIFNVKIDKAFEWILEGEAKGRNPSTKARR